MKYVFLGAFAILSALSFGAWLWRPKVEAGRTQLIWCVDDSPTRRAQVATFNHLYPEYTVKIDPVNGRMEKVIVQSLAGVGPDLFDCYSGFQLTAFVQSGVARDNTEDFKARGIDPKAIWPCLEPIYMKDGRLYGLPGNAHAPAIWYNKRLFDEAGEPYPPRDGWTWDELIEVAKRLTLRDAQGRVTQYGLIEVWEMDQWDTLIYIAYQYGGRVYTPEGTRCVLDSPEVIAAAEFIHDLTYVHGISPGPNEAKAMAAAGGWGVGGLWLFSAEKGAMAMGGRWWLNMLRGKDYQHLRLGAVPLPRGKVDRIAGTGRSTLINAATKNLEGALLFMEYLYGPHWNRIVNKEADALAPAMKYCYTDEFLHDPDHPEEDYNEVWREALERAEPIEVSPYVNGQTVDRILIKQTDMLKLNAKSPAQAMRDSARLVNRAIVEQLRRDPKLKERYMKAIEAGARPAWDRPEDAP